MPPSTPILPPEYGWWLAREAQGRFTSTGLVYVRPIAAVEVDELVEARRYFHDLLARPGVESLLARRRSWTAALGNAAQTPYLGPLNEQIVPQALEALLPVWRMALDFLKGAVTTQFGRTSAQAHAYRAATHRAYDTYFGYRLVEALRNAHLHHSIPALRQRVTYDVVICDRCAEEHRVNPELVVELPREYLLSLDKCPAVLKRELPSRPEYLDLRCAVTEAMHGFFEVLSAVASFDQATAARVRALNAMWAQVAPDQPLLVHSWEGERGSRVAVETFADLDWVRCRTTR
ncbi:hypothetical protein Rhe02_18560 [Rhizocola hellebori]|uniref:Uncharacterized protein n=2 Tax=Rhizocola hellebori TaxID=1392758 RepID=A0A8J3VDR8_9ACTN|nr:hypothetical protein Rhe02_18560 [Rhizocola hellebori]